MPDPMKLDSHPSVVAAREQLEAREAELEKLRAQAQRERDKAAVLAEELHRIETAGDTESDYVALHKKMLAAEETAQAATLKTRPAEGAVRVAKSALFAAYAEAAIESAHEIQDALRARVPELWEATEELADVAAAVRSHAGAWRQGQAMVHRAQDAGAFDGAWPLHPNLEWAVRLDHDTLQAVDQFVRTMREARRRLAAANPTTPPNQERAA